MRYARLFREVASALDPTAVLTWLTIATIGVVFYLDPRIGGGL